MIMPRKSNKARPKPKKNQSQIDKLIEELIKKEGKGGESEQEKQEKTI